jgi:hypothetical protein
VKRYDNNNNVIESKSYHEDGSTSFESFKSYDDDGREIENRTTYENGDQESLRTFTHDTNGDETEIVDYPDGSKETYKIDKDGNIISETLLDKNGKEYKYDDETSEKIYTETSQPASSEQTTGTTTSEKTFENPGVTAETWSKWLPELKKGATIEYTTLPDGRTKATIKSKANTSKKYETKELTNVIGTGSTDIYNTDIAGQGEAISENPNYTWIPGYNSTGTRAENQGMNKAGTATGSEDLISAESIARFEENWGDVITQVEKETGKPWTWEGTAESDQWSKFQTLSEEQRKKDAAEAGVPYVPYHVKKGSKGYVKGSGFDGTLGAHTMNKPRLKKNDVFSDEAVYGDLTKKERNPIETIIPEQYAQADPEFWIQDQNNLMALGQMENNAYYPWAPDAEKVNLNPTFDDWRSRVNANSSDANGIAQALGAAGGPQAIANSDIQGKTMDANARAINTVNSNNVQTANQFGAMQAQYDMAINQENAKRQIGVYDGTQKVNQGLDNFNNERIKTYAELQNAAITNRANTANLNSTFDNMAIDPTTGGLIHMTNPRGLEKVGDPGDRSEQFWNRVSDFQRNSNTTEFNKGLWDAHNNFVYSASGGPGQNKYQQSLAANKGQMGRTGAKTGKEVRRMVVPFYTGKMGN